MRNSAQKVCYKMCFSKFRISTDSFTIIRPILSHLTSPTNNDIQVTQQKKMLHLPRSALYVIYIFFHSKTYQFKTWLI